MTTTPEPMSDDGTLIPRAMAAYYRAAAREPGPGEPPIPGRDSYVIDHGGKAYVVLTNVNGLLAVYRVRTDGMLKRLRRWPVAIEPESQGYPPDGARTGGDSR